MILTKLNETISKIPKTNDELQAFIDRYIGLGSYEPKIISPTHVDFGDNDNPSAITIKPSIQFAGAPKLKFTGNIHTVNILTTTNLGSMLEELNIKAIHIRPEDNNTTKPLLKCKLPVVDTLHIRHITGQIASIIPKVRRLITVHGKIDLKGMQAEDLTCAYNNCTHLPSMFQYLKSITFEGTTRDVIPAGFSCATISEYLQEIINKHGPSRKAVLEAYELLSEVYPDKPELWS